MMKIFKLVIADISHNNPEGTEKPISCGSRTLPKAERNYTQIDR